MGHSVYYVFFPHLPDLKERVPLILISLPLEVLVCGRSLGHILYLISISDWVFGHVWSCSTLFIMKTSHKSDELKNKKRGGPQIGYLWDIGGAQNIFVWGFWKTDLNIVEYYLIFSCRIEPFKHMNSTRKYFFYFLWEDRLSDRRYFEPLNFWQKMLRTIEPSYHSTIGIGGRRGRDCMVVGFSTTCAISAYHH